MSKLVSVGLTGHPVSCKWAASRERLRPVILLLCFLGVQLFLQAQDSAICYLRDPDGRIREHNADFIKMLLDVKFDTREGKVIGDMKYEFRPIQFVMDT